MLETVPTESKNERSRLDEYKNIKGGGLKVSVS